MAAGRMLQKKISLDREIVQLMDLVNGRLAPPHGAYAALLFTWCIAHLDRDGRMHGDPTLVKSQVLPRITEVTPQQVEVYLTVMAELGLVTWYEANGDRWLCMPNFRKNQPGMRYEKEPASDIPPPEVGRHIAAGVTPDGRQQDAQPADIGRQNGIEEKRREDPPRAREATSMPPRTWKGGLDQIWLQITGVWAQRGFGDLADALEEAAKRQQPPIEPGVYAERAIRAFNEWVDGIEREDRKPQKLPEKMLANIGYVQDIVAGRRSAGHRNGASSEGSDEAEKRRHAERRAQQGDR